MMPTCAVFTLARGIYQCGPRNALRPYLESNVEMLNADKTHNLSVKSAPIEGGAARYRIAMFYVLESANRPAAVE